MMAIGYQYYSHSSWGMRIIGGILPGMVDYILHALPGRLNARGEAFLLMVGQKRIGEYSLR
jgi:hypothetical protein